ncbi:MAG TPA: TetR/AcrR family transcriptional regulator [Burkholderiales bacterium]
MEVNDARIQQGSETQKTLRREARKLFTRKGYSGANTNELVERASVTKGALYHHFANKKELYEAVVEDVEQELVEKLEAAGAGRRPWDRLLAMCRAYLDACRDPALARMLVLEAPVVLGWKTWCNLEQKYEVAAFARCLGEAGALSEPAETLAQVILGALTTGARVIATSADPDKARAEVERTIDRLLAGLRTTAT